MGERLGGPVRGDKAFPGRHLCNLVSPDRPGQARRLHQGPEGTSGLGAFAAELVIDPAAARIRGCGVAVVNPPWRFDGEARAILAYLEKKLALSDGAQGSVRWVVSK